MSPLERVENVVADLQELSTTAWIELNRVHFNELKAEIEEEYEHVPEVRMTKEKITNQLFSMAELYIHGFHITFYIKD